MSPVDPEPPGGPVGIGLGAPEAPGYRGSMSDLANQPCVPCRGGVDPLKGADLKALQDRLGSGWEVVEEHHLSKTFSFPDFAEALAFVNRVGALAEEVGHHPDIWFTWGKARVEIFTHKIDGLAEADFVLAAKVERLAG